MITIKNYDSSCELSNYKIGDVYTFYIHNPMKRLAKVKEDPDVPVLVRGDERLTYGAIMDVVKLVYKCKVKKMALVTVEK